MWVKDVQTWVRMLGAVLFRVDWSSHGLVFQPSPQEDKRKTRPVHRAGGKILSTDPQPLEVQIKERGVVA